MTITHGDESFTTRYLLALNAIAGGVKGRRRRALNPKVLRLCAASGKQKT
jgi:hypothetical protein